MKLKTRQRATSDDQKLRRKQSVLTAAKVLFNAAGFFEVSMSSIAKEAGVAKGTVYLYFDTKEEIFLALAMEELSKWFSDVETALRQTSDHLENDELLKIMRHALEDRDSLYDLVSFLHSVLEKNVSYEQAVDFKRALLHEILTVSPLIEDRLPYLKKGEGVVVLTQFYALMLGWVQMTQSSDMLDQVLDLPDLALFKHDRQMALFNSMSLILDGFQSRGHK